MIEPAPVPILDFCGARNLHYLHRNHFFNCAGQNDDFCLIQNLMIQSKALIYILPKADNSIAVCAVLQVIVSTMCCPPLHLQIKSNQQNTPAKTKIHACLFFFSPTPFTRVTHSKTKFPRPLTESSRD